MTTVQNTPLEQALHRFHGELRPLDDHGQPRRSRLRPGAGGGTLWLLPTLAVVGLVVVLPVVVLIVDSVAVGSWASYRRALTDPQLWTAALNTGFYWALLVPLVAIATGYVFAALTRDLQARLLVPMAFLLMALPMVVVGVMFRLLYAPRPSLGPVTALLHLVAGWFGVPPERITPLLGEDLVSIALISAFLWAWVWLAAVMFRSALERIPPDLENVVRGEGGGRWRVFRDVRWPFLRRTFALLMFLFAVMASRAFDLVLVMAPGSVQHVAEVLGLYVLRQPTVAAQSEATAVSVIWLAVVGLGALLAFRVPHDWPTPAISHESRRIPPRRWYAARRVAFGVLLVVWTTPLVYLLLVSLSDPVSLVVGGWLRDRSLANYEALLRAGVLEALWPTFGVAVAATVGVVVIASFAAHALAWLQPYGATAMTVLLLLCAVVPIQVTAGALNDTLVRLGLPGDAVTVTIVHIGRGLPIAVLLLHNAFRAVAPADVARERLRSRTEVMVLIRRVADKARHALVAVGALEFILVWNDLAVGFLFGGAEFTPVALALFGQSRQFTTSAGVLAAGGLIAAVPPVIVALLAHRAIVTGLISGVVRR